MSTDQSEVTADVKARTAKGRRTLLLLLLVSVAPVVAAYFSFYVWRPSAQASYGTVVSPVVALPIASLRSLNDVPLVEEIRGKWTMVLRAPSACNKDCQQKLYYMRQIRVIQAKEMDRVARLWVMDDAGQPDSALLAEHEGLLVVRDAPLAAALGEAGQIALIDPRGNLMMRFPKDVDAKGIAKDVQKLLKYAR